MTTKTVTIWHCSDCGEEDHCGMGYENEMVCMACGKPCELDEDYIELTEEEYERWKRERPGRI